MTITLYGRHGCMAALKNPKRQIEKVWVSDDQLAFEIRHFWKNPIELIDKKIFKTLLPHFNEAELVCLEVTDHRERVSFAEFFVE